MRMQPPIWPRYIPFTPVEHEWVKTVVIQDIVSDEMLNTICGGHPQRSVLWFMSSERIKKACWADFKVLV